MPLLPGLLLSRRCLPMPLIIDYYAALHGLIRRHEMLLILMRRHLPMLAFAYAMLMLIFYAYFDALLPRLFALRHDTLVSRRAHAMMRAVAADTRLPMRYAAIAFIDDSRRRLMARF